MWSRNSNNCQFKDMCPLGDQSCSYSRSGNFSECGNYQMWSGEDNPCPYKNKCSDYPHLCLYAGNLDACFKYGRFSGDEISRMVDENWKSDNQEDEEDLFDVENIDEDENFEEDEEVEEEDIEEEEDDDDEDDDEDDDDEDEDDDEDDEDEKDEDDNVANHDTTENEQKFKLEKTLAFLHKMPELSVFNSKQAFCFGKTFLYLFLREKESDEWLPAGKVRHQLQMHQGVLIPIRNELYLWNNQQCYVLKMNRAVVLDFGFLKSRNKLSESNEREVSTWQWFEMKRDDFINKYLCATERDPLQTKVTDRETRARNIESAVHELNSESWKYYLDMSEMWILDKEIKKCERHLKESKKPSKNKQQSQQKKKSIAKASPLPTSKNIEQLKHALDGSDGKKSKSHIVAGILAILLGSFGAHKFYMGKIWMGLLYLVFCWSYIPFIIGVIEGIKYLTEGQERFSERLQD